VRIRLRLCSVNDILATLAEWKGGASVRTNGKPRAIFKTTGMANVPTGRKGKHHEVVSAILKDLEGLEEGNSLKIRVAELPDTVVNVRSALNRATRKLGNDVRTATDEDFLYIWNGPPVQKVRG